MPLPPLCHQILTIWYIKSFKIIITCSWTNPNLNTFVWNNVEYNAGVNHPVIFFLNILPMLETDGSLSLSLMSNAVWRKLLRKSIEGLSRKSPRTSNEARWTLTDLQGVGRCLEWRYYSQHSRTDTGRLEMHKGRNGNARVTRHGW